jgi:hypothetical protein
MGDPNSLDLPTGWHGVVEDVGTAGAVIEEEDECEYELSSERIHESENEPGAARLGTERSLVHMEDVAPEKLTARRARMALLFQKGVLSSDEARIQDPTARSAPTTPELQRGGTTPELERGGPAELISTMGLDPIWIEHEFAGICDPDTVPAAVSLNVRSGGGGGDGGTCDV